MTGGDASSSPQNYSVAGRVLGAWQPGANYWAGNRLWSTKNDVRE
jgi:hypothetical protein